MGSVMDELRLTDEQDELRDVVTRIATKYDRRYWLDCADSGKYPTELWRALADAGILGITVPPEYGGSGGGATELVVVAETLNYHGIFVSSMGHLNFSRAAVTRYGTEEQKELLLRPSVTGDVKVSLCATEPDAGTNTFKVRTLARPRPGGGYVLNGRKLFIGGADVADYYVVIARTVPFQDVADKREGMAIFLVDAKSAGIEIAPMDIVVADCVRRFFVNFDDVELPATALIGQPGDGLAPMFHNLNQERVIACANNIGCGYFMLQKAVDYVREREVFDRPIGSYQAVQHPLARAKAKLDSARLMTYDAARRHEAGQRSARYSNMTKLLSSEAAWEAADAAIQFHGGYAFDRSTDLWDMFAHIRLSRVAPLNNEMVLNYIGERVLGLPRSY